MDKDTSLKNTNDPTEVNGPQVDEHTLEKNIVSKLQSGMKSVITTLKIRLKDAVLTAIESLIIPRVELAMKLVNASYGYGVDSVVLEPDQRDFSGNMEGFQMTASSRINSHTDIDRIDETRGNITVKRGRGDLLVKEGNIDRQTHNHHRSTKVWSVGSHLISLCALLLQ